MKRFVRTPGGKIDGKKWLKDLNVILNLSAVDFCGLMESIADVPKSDIPEMFHNNKLSYMHIRINESKDIVDLVLNKKAFMTIQKLCLEFNDLCGEVLKDSPSKKIDLYEGKDIPDEQIDMILVYELIRHTIYNIIVSCIKDIKPALYKKLKKDFDISVIREVGIICLQLKNKNENNGEIKFNEYMNRIIKSLEEIENENY